MSYVPDLVVLYEIVPYIEYLALDNKSIRVAVKYYLEGGRLNGAAIEKYGPIGAFIKKYGPLGDWNTSKVTNMTYLFYNYKEFKKNGYKEPAEVTAATNEYQKEQDAYSEFVTDCLKLDKTYYADVKEVYTVFQEYVRYNNDQKPSKKAFEKYMNTRFGKFGRHRDSKCWKGFKIDEAALNENYGISENPEDELL